VLRADTVHGYDRLGAPLGLDIVEVVLRCEESFEVKLDPARLDQMRTVGDLFEIVCGGLNIPGGSAMPSPTGESTLTRTAVPAERWTRDKVWLKLVHICVDQLQVNPEEVTYAASFVEDLGAD
jgi:acyl carrier protein